MATPVSLILIAVGLVLALAVHPRDTSSIDVNTVGWIIFGVGLFGMILTFMFWDSWFGPGYWRRRRAYPATAGYPPAAPRRTTVVEEEDVPPPVEPPPPPP
jgi:hypothetical protein